MSADVTAATLGAVVKAPVENVIRIPGGFSKETFLFDALRENGAREPLVLRRDLPAGPAQATVVDEFRVLRALHRAGVPVPEALSVEPDASVLGQPFLVMRRVEGSASAGDKPREVGLAIASVLRCFNAAHCCSCKIHSTGSVPSGWVGHDRPCTGG